MRRSSAAGALVLLRLQLFLLGLPDGAIVAGLEGITTAKNVDDCLGHKCQNGGVCVKGVNTYNCHCPSQWTGQYCSEDVDECQLQPNACQNGGTCANHPGGYSCVCVNGWSGEDCSENIDDCASGTCAPGSTCIDRVASFSCICPEGKTGLLCKVNDACISNPCQVGAQCYANPLNGQYICMCPQGYRGATCTDDVDECVIASSNPCEHGGKCINTKGSFHCECLKGYTGPRCEMDVNECFSEPCQNDATCLDKIGGFVCLCMPGFTGLHCETDINECQSSPCLNNGECIDKINTFLCICPAGFTGKACQVDMDECSSTPCLNGAKCVDHPNGYECQCATGFTGLLCEENINNCDPDPCHHGDCQDGIDSYTCVCNPGYVGPICSEQIDECRSSPCLNNARCIDRVNGYKCICLSGTSGIHCEKKLAACGSNHCLYGSCVKSMNSYRCVCEPGVTGHFCETIMDLCFQHPCQNGGTCSVSGNVSQDFVCHCPAGFGGKRCEVSVLPSLKPASCLNPLCLERSRDGYCDKECNTHECQWDGGDCSLTVEDPWANCSLSFRCWQLINGQCDEICNTAECLFDNFECLQESKTCKYEGYCIDHFADGHCDQGCNSVACGWDGLDCAGDTAEILAEGILVIVVLMPPEELLRNIRSFLRTLGSILHTNLRIKLDSDGKQMIFPYYGEQVSAQIPRAVLVVRRSKELEREVIGTKLFLEMDNRQCVEHSGQCFKSTESAAALLAVQAIQGSLPYPLVAVQGKPLEPKKTQLFYLLAVVPVIALFFVLLSIVVTKQKRKSGCLWLPEGFKLHTDPSSQRRREPVGEDAVGLKDLSGQATECNPPASNQNEHAATDGQPQPKRPKVEDESLLTEGGEPVDRRQWTFRHLEAADVCRVQSHALTPPQGDRDAGGVDVNVRGPDGCTPLMLASWRIGSSDLNTDENATNLIMDLIYQGANIHAQTDCTGETALHLAARYSRADAAQLLLNAGANANARDKIGRTPLHAAVAADAQGVFQILLRNREIDPDAQMNDGTTPLVLAARLAIEGMVGQLIDCQADINAVDNYGKSALHWAVAVNNTETTELLLKSGGNADMQDNKEETPLFLAAQEGSFEAAQILLDHFANQGIPDHMGRLPRDVAQDRMHHDIVQLLDRYNLAPSPSSTMLAPDVSPVVRGQNQSVVQLKRASSSKKLQASNVKHVTPPNLSKDTRKRRKKPLGDSKGQLAGSSVALSPVDSLESPHSLFSEATPSTALPSLGTFHSSPNLLVPAASVPLPPTGSVSSLCKMQPVHQALGTACSSSSQLFSQLNHALPARPGQLRAVGLAAEWLAQMEAEPQYSEMYHTVSQAAHVPTSVSQQSFLQANGKPLGDEEALPPVIAFPLPSQGGASPHLLLQQSPSTYVQDVDGFSGSMYQEEEAGRVPSVFFPMAVIAQGGQETPSILLAYHPYQSVAGKHPTQSSQNGGLSAAAERTASHRRLSQGQHPYLTPSPEPFDHSSSSSPNSDWSVMTSNPIHKPQQVPASPVEEPRQNNLHEAIGMA